MKAWSKQTKPSPLAIGRYHAEEGAEDTRVKCLTLYRMLRGGKITMKEFDDSLCRIVEELMTEKKWSCPTIGADLLEKCKTQPRSELTREEDWKYSQWLADKASWFWWASKLDKWHEKTRKETLTEQDMGPEPVLGNGGEEQRNINEDDPRKDR